MSPWLGVAGEVYVVTGGVRACASVQRLQFILDVCRTLDVFLMFRQVCGTYGFRLVRSTYGFRLLRSSYGLLVGESPRVLTGCRLLSRGISSVAVNKMGNEGSSHGQTGETTRGRGKGPDRDSEATNDEEETYPAAYRWT